MKGQGPHGCSGALPGRNQHTNPAAGLLSERAGGLPAGPLPARARERFAASLGMVKARRVLWRAMKRQAGVRKGPEVGTSRVFRTETPKSKA